MLDQVIALAVMLDVVLSQGVRQLGKGLASRKVLGLLISDFRTAFRFELWRQGWGTRFACVGSFAPIKMTYLAL